MKTKNSKPFSHQNIPTEAGNQKQSSGIFNFGSKTGFSLLETVVAISILISAVVGPVTLVSSSLFAFPFAKNKLIALNLAQEGTELIRVIRDQNIQCVINGAPGWTWDTDFDGAGKTLAPKPGRRIDATQDEPLTCAGDPPMTFKNPVIYPGPCPETKLRLDSFGRYGYDPSGNETIFSRCIDTKKPTTDDPDAIPKEDIMEVTSTVYWNEHGIERSVTLKARLYNWKKP